MATGNPPRKRSEKRATPEGQVLAHARKRNGYTQRELADLVGVHYSMIAQVEAGWRPCPERVALLLVDELDVPLYLLIEPVEESA